MTYNFSGFNSVIFIFSREEREKVNVTWNENGTVSYRQIKRWYYQPDKTIGSLKDPITTLNVPMVVSNAAF